MEHFQIVSPPLPTGVTWLVNVLLELGVRCTSYGSSWLEGADGSYPVSPDKLRYLLWHLPALHRQQGFAFRPDAEVFWDHQLAYAQYPARKTILFARDLRDSAYSYACRQLNLPDVGHEQLLSELHKPRTWPDYFPHLFDLPLADTLGYFYLIWLTLIPERQLLVLRFEDCKADPLGQLRRVCAFLNLSFGEAELTRALQASELGRFQEIRRMMEARAGYTSSINRKGLPLEWKTLAATQSTEFHACFEGTARKALNLLGYEPPPMPAPAAVALGPEGSRLYRELNQQLQQNRLPEAIARLSLELPALRDPQLRRVGAGQLLALLWTRAILGPAQQSLPQAARLARLLTSLNAEFVGFERLQAAAAQILERTHPLRQLPSAPWAADSRLPLAQALEDARKRGLPYLLWQQPGVLLTTSGLQQLEALLDGRDPLVRAAIPTFSEPALRQREFLERSAELHRVWGAEFRLIRVRRLPACMLLRTDAFGASPLRGEPESWLAELVVQQAIGVLAAWER